MTQVEAEHIFTSALYRIRTGVVVVMSTPWSSLTPEEVTLFTKILGSVKLSLDSVRIIEAPAVDDSLVEIFNPPAILAFGATGPASLPRYQAGELNGIPLVLADAISDLDDARKKSLWGALRQAFRL